MTIHMRASSTISSARRVGKRREQLTFFAQPSLGEELSSAGIILVEGDSDRSRMRSWSRTTHCVRVTPGSLCARSNERRCSIARGYRVSVEIWARDERTAATIRPGRAMLGELERTWKWRTLKVARKSAPQAMAAARIGTSFGSACEATSCSSVGAASGTRSTATSRIRRNGGTARGSFTARFRSDSWMARGDVRQAIKVSSESCKRMWLAPRVEAAPAIRTSASQKMRTKRGASTLGSAAPAGPATLRPHDTTGR